MSKYICPKCDIPLTAVKEPRGIFWRCESCDGRSITLALLRKSIPANMLNELWHMARSETYPRKCICPACHNRMVEVPAMTEHGKQFLDVCTVCQFVWFDYNEYAAFPSILPTPSWEETLPQEMREKMALLEIESIRRKSEGGDWGTSEPDAWWEWIVGMIGMPIEQEVDRVNTLPWITWGLALLIVAFSLVGFSDLKATINSFGLIPADFGRYSGLTFLTSFFLHGGFLHLIGNVYFLLVFGDNVEDCLGKWSFFLLVASAALIGDITHILGDPSSTTPCIGASGGISGIMAFYALKFPKVKLRFLMRIFVLFHWVALPAYAMFLIWLSLQFFGVGAQLKGYSNVSSLAHLGGAGVGFLFWLFSRNSTTNAKYERLAGAPSTYLRKYRD